MKAIVFAETKGRRMGALTKNVPKPMLLVSEKPILEHIIESIREGDIKELIISVSFKKEVVKEYFRGGERFGVSITYFEPKIIKGMANSLLKLRTFVQDKNFVVVQADIIFGPELIREISTQHIKGDRLVTVAVSRALHIAPSHKIVTVNGEKIIEIKNALDKTSQNMFRCIGVWAFSPSIFDALSSLEPPPDREWTIMTALKSLLERGVKLNYYVYEGKWYDFHYPKDLSLYP